MYPFVLRLNAAGWAHLFVYGLLLPLMVVGARRKVVGSHDAPLPDRLRYFQGTTIELLMLTAGSLAVARAERMQLFPSAFPPWYGIVAGIAAYAIAVFFMRPRWRRAVERNTRVAHLFMPSNGTERAWWLVVSVLAGTGEEITWRAVQTGLLAAATGSYATAAILSALSFGVAHAVQGWRSSAVIVVFALGFQTLVWLIGSLYVAMAVHILYDITAGISYGRLARQLGYAPAGMVANG
jgi:membrane protease YdiL (CAAX protease family)